MIAGNKNEEKPKAKTPEQEGRKLKAKIAEEHRPCDKEELEPPKFQLSNFDLYVSNYDLYTSNF